MTGTARATGLLATIAALGLGLAPAAQAETLDEAWALALRQDQSLAAARSHADAAVLQSEAARAQRWPTIAVSGAYTQLDDSPAFDFAFTGLPLMPPELFDDDDFVSGAAAITVPLYTGGRISSSIAAADAGRRGADARLVAATADLKLAVATAYVDVLRARKALVVARSNVQTLESVAGDTSSLFERELVPKNELLAAQVALAHARQNELRAAHAAEVALAAYNRRLGAPMDRVVEPDATIAVALEQPSTLEAATAQALARRAELAALDAQAAGFGQMAQTERSRVLPQVALSGGYQHLDNQFLDDENIGMAGIGVQWSLFDGGQSRRRAAAFERTRRATEQQRADVASLVALEVRQAWLGVEESRRRLEVTAGAAAQADENLRIAQERYRAGLGTQTQLLEAETMRIQALGNRDTAALDAELARLSLARASGAL